MAIHFADIFTMVSDFALHPSTNSSAQEDKYPNKSDKKLKMIVSAFDKLEVDIREAMDTGDPGKFGDSNPHPILNVICKSKFDVWKRQHALEFEVAPTFQSRGGRSNNNNNPRGNNPNGNHGHHGGGGYNGNTTNSGHGHGNANGAGAGAGRGAEAMIRKAKEATMVVMTAPRSLVVLKKL
jgi:hypothetical protein